MTLLGGQSRAVRAGIAAVLAVVAGASIWTASQHLPALTGVVGALVGVGATGLTLLFFIELVGERQRERDTERRREMRAARADESDDDDDDPD